MKERPKSRLEALDREAAPDSSTRKPENGRYRSPACMRDAQYTGASSPKKRDLQNELPLLISIERASSELGIGRSLLYELLGSHQLPSIKIGRRRFIRRDDLLQFVRELPTLGAPQ